MIYLSMTSHKTFKFIFIEVRYRFYQKIKKLEYNVISFKTIFEINQSFICMSILIGQ
jgi:hypothetical protein